MAPLRPSAGPAFLQHIGCPLFLHDTVLCYLCFASLQASTVTSISPPALLVALVPFVQSLDPHLRQTSTATRKVNWLLRPTLCTTIPDTRCSLYDCHNVYMECDVFLLGKHTWSEVVFQVPHVKRTSGQGETTFLAHSLHSPHASPPVLWPCSGTISLSGAANAANARRSGQGTRAYGVPG